MIPIMFEAIERFFRDASPREFSFRAGDAVFLVGDPIRLVHLVRAGTIHLVRHQPDGSALILQRAGENAVLAEASVYSGSYHCDARAIDEARTCAIPKSHFLKRLNEDADLGRAWGHYLAYQVQKARLQSEIVSLKTVTARLDAWLGWHGAVPPRGKWSALAAEIGTSPEALYREMAKRRRNLPGPA